MRLIDADALKKAIPETRVDIFENCRYCVLLDKEQVTELIDAAPTIEIDRPTRSQFKRMAAQLGYEPVVHCKNCRLGEPDTIVNGYKDDFWCKYYEHPKPAYGFCEKGERKNNGNEDRA